MVTPTRLRPLPPPAAGPAAEQAFQRTDRVLSRVVMAACAVLVVVGLGPSLLGLNVFASSDSLYELPPWSAQVGPDFAPANAYVGDPLDALYPPTIEAIDRLRDGDLGAWTSLQAGGSELGVTPSLALLSPTSLPVFLMPMWLAPAYIKLLEILVAAGGMALFCRRIGLGRAASWLGGLAFVTSSFLIAWTNWPQTRTAAFAPVLLWALERLLQDRDGRSLALVSLSVAALVFGGFPSVTAYVLYTAAAYVLVRVIAAELRRPARGRVGRLVAVLGMAAGGVVGGLALAAVQLVPFLHQLGEVYIGSRDQTPQHSLSVVSLTTALVPDGLGTPVSRSAWLGPRNPIESFSYIGVAVALLAALGMLGLRRARASRATPAPADERLDVDATGLGDAPAGPPLGVRTFLVVAVLVWGVAIYAGGPVLAAIQQLPAMGINPIGRARSVLGLLIAVLAAIGFDQLLRAAVRGRSAAGDESEPGRREWLRLAGWLLVAAAVAALIVAGQQNATAEGFDASYGRSTLVAGAWAIAALGAVVLALRGGWFGTFGLFLLPAIVLGQAAVAVQPWWPESPRASFFPATATHDFLAANLGHDRYLSTGDAMLPGSNLAYGLRSLDGHAFMRTGFADLLRAVDPGGFVAATLWHPDLESAASAGPLLDRLGVRYLVAPPDAPVLGVERVVDAGVDSVALAPGRVLTVELGSSSVRGVGVVLADPVPTAAVLEVRLLAVDGEVVAQTVRRVAAGSAPGSLVVPLVGEGADAVTAEVVLVGAEPIDVTGVDGAPSLVVVEAANDGMRLVRTGETTIYERERALPRIRWAGSVGVETDPGSTMDLLRSGDAPDVVLGEGVGTESDPGSTAEVQVLEDSGDTIRARVDANGGGHLVVADALGDAFSATVDGAAVPIRTADHGYVAIAVPSGAHEVVIAYTAPGGPLAAGVSGAALLLLGGLLAVNPGAVRPRDRPGTASRWRLPRQGAGRQLVSREPG